MNSMPGYEKILIIISGKNGDDEKKYLEKQINQKLAKLKEIKK